MKLSFDFNLIQSFLFLLQVRLVFAELPVCFLTSSPFFFVHFFYFLVEVFLLLPKGFEFGLLHQLLSYILRKLLELQLLGEFIAQALCPIAQFALVLSDAFTVAVYVWVVLQLAAQLAG